MIKKYINIIFLFLFVFAFGEISAQNKPIAKEGYIDISDWDFGNAENISLEGEWEFYWSELLEPKDFNDGQHNPVFVEVPGSWTGTKIGDTIIENTGYATYRLKIFSKKQQLSIVFKEVLTAYSVWLNGKKITSVGIVGTNEKSNTPVVRMNIEKFLLKEGENELIIQVSNYQHRTNAFDVAPVIGQEEKLDREVVKSVSLDFLVLGFLIIMAFYHFGIFILNRKNNLALIFSIFAFIVSLRALVTSNFLLSLLFQSFSWKFIYFISYSSYYIAFPLIILYLQKTFEEKRFRWIFNILYIVSGIFVLTLLLPSLIYTKLLMIYQIMSVIYVIFSLVLLVGYSVKGKTGAKIFLVSILFAFLTFTNDILYYNDVLNTSTILPLGLFILFLGQALTLSKIFTEKFTENENLKIELDQQNKELQNKINDRLQELNNQNVIFSNQNKKLENLNFELNKYFEVLEQTPLAIVLTDTEPIIEYANNAYFSISKFKKEELLGKNPSIVKSGKTPKTTIKKLWETILAGKTWQGEFINKSKDGSEYIEKAIITPIKDTSEKIIKYLALKENITSLRAKENQIKSKNTKLKDLYSKLQKSNNQIVNNLEYSNKLQSALLPDVEKFSEKFDDYFIFYVPKAQVGGDFYYMNNFEEKIIFGVGDCTGHGVPGSFMTVLSITTIKQIISENYKIEASEILEELRSRIKSIFRTFGTETQDGLDMAICSYDEKTKELLFSGANLPLIIVKGNEIIQKKGIRNPIGFYPVEKSFQNHIFNIEKGDIIYLYSDGVTDQFNDNSLKLTRKRLIKFIENNLNLPLDEQKRNFITFFNDWKGSTDQIDDITLMGVKF